MSGAACDDREFVAGGYAGLGFAGIVPKLSPSKRSEEPSTWSSKPKSIAISDDGARLR